MSKSMILAAAGLFALAGCVSQSEAPSSDDDDQDQNQQQQQSVEKPAQPRTDLTTQDVYLQYPKGSNNRLDEGGR